MTADELVEGAIVVEDGYITEIDCLDRVGGPDSRDAHGFLAVPGLIDTHSDGLEKEISPRRTTRFPMAFALGSFEGRARAAGITTLTHGIGYQNKPDMGRSPERASELHRLVCGRMNDPAAAIDHRVLYRVEARDPEGLGPLLRDLEATGGEPAPLVSFEDHTPGQGQFRDVAQYAAAVDPSEVPDGETVESYVQSIIDRADQLVAVRDENLSLLTPLALDGRITLLGHDLETPTEVASALAAGATVAEFPLTLESATAASDAGMSIVMGAPNALRGGSHSGNASARELVSRGLCDVIASDYMPTAMLAAAFAMARHGVCSLPQAIGLVTSGPAAVIGAHDRGQLQVGAVADIVLVDDRAEWPQVVGVHRAADRVEVASVV